MCLKKIIFLIGFILYITLPQCGNNERISSGNKSLTLPYKTIKSNGLIVHKPFTRNQIDKFKKVIKSIMLKIKVKGISAAVAIPDKGLWYTARGVTGNNINKKVTANMKFCAGSIGKIFTAVLIMKLIEQNRVSLNSKISKWFPEFNNSSLITVNHLLTHTSGIAGFDNANEYKLNKYRCKNPIQVLSYLKNKKSLFKPGKHFAYSNINYLMLGIIIEKITGKSYQEAIKKYIINKINLRHTDVIAKNTSKNPVVRGHHRGIVLNNSLDYTALFGAGSIIATPMDLIIFLHALLNGKLLSKNSLKKMFSNMNLMKITQKTYYGKGIAAALKTPIGTIIGHSGGVNGFRAALYYYPKDNVFVCAMINDDKISIDPAIFTFIQAINKT